MDSRRKIFASQKPKIKNQGFKHLSDKLFDDF
jgi:hypothetical protein